MIQLNQYKKVCYLTDTEKDKIDDFFTNMFDVKMVKKISIYPDICEIEGFEEETYRVIGSFAKHDKEK